MTTRAAIPGGPLAAVAIGVFCAALPLAPHVPLFAFSLFLVALVARAWMHRMQTRLPSLAAKLIVLVLGVAGVGFASGTLIGIEPGIGILLILVALKLLEVRTARDFQVLVLLGWFLGLCRLFFSQDLSSWIQAGAVGLFLTGALLAFHGANVREAARTALVMGAQAAPLVALLFVLFPRAYTGVRFSFTRGLFADTGLAERIDPGGFAGLAQNDAPAFRVEFPDGPPPAPERRYFRASVLWHGDGLVWTRGPMLRPAFPRETPSAPGIRQRIVMQPHGANWIFALDWPVGKVRGANFEAGEFFQTPANRPVLQTMIYEVESRMDANLAPLPRSHRDAALQLPKPRPTRAEAVVKQWRAKFPDDRAFVGHALEWIGSEDFNYTLAPGEYDDVDGLDEFLFDRRAGYCEHYAAAFTTLMRLGGVPARLVIGYFGGEFYEVGNYLLVRQSDAHCWCEVWIEGAGWTRIDPTNAIAADRVAAGLRSLLDSRAARDSAAQAEAANPLGWRSPLRQARMIWDNLNHQWDLRVLSYDEEEQRSLLAFLGLGAVRGAMAVGAILFFVLIVIGLVAALLRRPWRRADDPVVRAWQRFCRALAAAGIARERWEGPVEFGARAASALPAHADFIGRATHLYIVQRYSPAPPPPREFLHALRLLPHFARPSVASCP